MSLLTSLKSQEKHVSLSTFSKSQQKQMALPTSSNHKRRYVSLLTSSNDKRKYVSLVTSDIIKSQEKVHITGHFLCHPITKESVTVTPDVIKSQKQVEDLRRLIILFETVRARVLLAFFFSFGLSGYITFH